MTTDHSSPSNSDPEQPLAIAWQARDQALASAQRWQRLYEVEAQQRQKDAEVADQALQHLRTEIQHLCQFSDGSQSSLSTSKYRSTTVTPNLPSHLHQQLTELITERDQLLQALAEEQNHHAQTRENLINALSDAIESQPQKQASSLPASRAGAIILKDRNGRQQAQPEKLGR